MDGYIIENTFLENNLNDRDKIISVIYDSTSDLIFLINVDSDGGFSYLSVNRTFVNITGLSKSKCIGKPVDEIFNRKISDELISAFKTVVEKKEKIKLEIEFLANEKTLFFDVSLRPIPGVDGNCIYILVVARDITERKNKEVELLQLKAKAEESNRLKTALLSNMSHEFRTPLNGILGFADILIEELKNPEQKEMAINIVKSGKRLSSTLHSILELSRLEAERKEMYNTSIQLEEIISEISERYLNEVKRKGLFLNIEIKSPNLKLHLDESLLKQILHNLIDNAIKFTNAGSISIICQEMIEQGKTYISIKIIDTGIGISKENLEDIFKEFKQESEGMSRSHEGTGLGLTLAKKMTELMGGQILVESKKHKGSTFTLKFPASSRRFDEMNVDDSFTEIKPVKKFDKLPLVLLVEDNELNIKLTTIYLKGMCNVETVQNADAALRLLNEKTYDAILLDINLGEGMNGVDIVQNIRSKDANSKIPVIAITGYALNDDRNNLLKCGFSHYLAKPFEKSQLIALMNEALTIDVLQD